MKQEVPEFGVKKGLAEMLKQLSWAQMRLLKDVDRMLKVDEMININLKMICNIQPAESAQLNLPGSPE